LIQAQLEELLGFEIVGQSARYCLIKNVASALDSEFDAILRRLFLLILSMAKESQDAIKKGDYSALKDIAEMEKVSNKLTFFCQRVLNKRGYKDFKKTAMMYNLVCLIEGVADDLRNICLYLYSCKGKFKISKDLAHMYSLMLSTIEDAYKLFYNFNFEAMFKLTEKKLKVEDYALKVFSKKDEKDFVVTHHILTIVDKLHHMTVDMA
jgi:phosphate uptake regulator